MRRRFGDAWAHEVEQRRLFPWIAVAFGSGILLGFAADWPLSPWPACLAGACATVGAVASRHRPLVFGLTLGVVAMLAGFAALAWRVRAVDAPVLARPVIAKVSGFVESVEARGQGGRLVLLPDMIEGLPQAARPSRIRVTVRALAGLASGDYVRGTARMLPPPEPARPGGYDFARDAFFKGIGAVGSVSGRIERVAAPGTPPGGLPLAAAIDRARNGLTDRIAGAIGGQAGAVAAALITGKRGLIDEATNDVLRAAGIYHVVSISGLHMVLAAGVFFWLTRALLASAPAAALRWPIKKIAALAGMAGATAYCVFSGADVAAERSLLMILVMQGAILVDRPALSLRNVALSAIVVLAREPETLLGPSLQMSYGAVLGLITLAEWAARRERAGPSTGWPARAARWLATALVGTIATTLVASVATGPFGTYHFQNLQPLGVIGNAATLPLVSLVVMPAAIAGVLAYPFGLDRPVWTVMGWAVAGMLDLSRWVAALSGSVVVVPAFGDGALLLFSVALLWATLFGSGLRWLFVVPAVLGSWAAITAPRPDIFVARDGTGAAVRGPAGKLVVVGRASAFTAEQWLRADGDARRPNAPDLREGARCDSIGCTAVTANGKRVALLLDRRGFETDCARAALVISAFAAPRGCAAPLVDRSVLDARGTVALSFEPDGTLGVTGTRRSDETRPWFPRTDTRHSPAATLPPRSSAAGAADAAQAPTGDDDPEAFGPDDRSGDQ